MINQHVTPISGSFRDPAGFLYTREGTLLRQVNHSAKGDYDRFMTSGLYEKLVAEGLLVPHRETSLEHAYSDLAYKVLEPERVSFISYPYEWCFSQLRDAAITTLRIQLLAIEHGLSLKDASAFNIQFRDGRPVLIDTLSFEQYSGSGPWVAYRQFCEHFLAPLALMAYRDVRLLKLFVPFIHGIPLDLASRLLPRRSWCHINLFLHIHLHARMQQRYGGKTVDKGEMSKRLDQKSLVRIVRELLLTVERLSLKGSKTEWGDYYSDTNYSEDAFKRKQVLVREFVELASPRTAWDLGANTGEFSRIAAEYGASIIAFDIDPDAVEKGYRAIRERKIERLLPLILDVTNPSPGIGWSHDERHSLKHRGPVDLVLALALVHHLAISNNLPLEMIARFLSEITTHLIIEFVPKEDSQVERLLASRPDIFPHYTLEGFEAACSGYFEIVRKVRIEGTERTLFLMKKA
jgi:hypothetical protein